MQFGVCIDWYIYGVRQARIGKSVAVITVKSKKDCKGLSYPYWAEAKKVVFTFCVAKNGTTQA